MKHWYLPGSGSIFVQVLLSQIQQMKEAGFTAVWLPPPSDSVSPQGYLPRDLYVFDSQYGSASDLKELLRALEDAGIKSIADVVINHRCAHKQVTSTITIRGKKQIVTWDRGSCMRRSGELWQVSCES